VARLAEVRHAARRASRLDLRRLPPLQSRPRRQRGGACGNPDSGPRSNRHRESIHDLIRLGLSLASAARGSDLPGVGTAKMLEHDGARGCLRTRILKRKGNKAQPELVKKIQQAGRACHVDDIRGEADETRARHRREWLNTRHSCAMPERSGASARGQARGDTAECRYYYRLRLALKARFAKFHPTLADPPRRPPDSTRKRPPVSTRSFAFEYVTTIVRRV